MSIVLIIATIALACFMLSVLIGNHIELFETILYVMSVVWAIILMVCLLIFIFGAIGGVI